MSDSADTRYAELDGLLATALARAETVCDAGGESPLTHIVKARAACRERSIIPVTFYCMQANGCAAANPQFAAVTEAMWPAMILALDIKAAEGGGLRAIPLTERDLGLGADGGA